MIPHPLHMLPTDDLSRPDLYLSRQQLPGMVPLSDLGVQLYAQWCRPLEMETIQLGHGDFIELGVGTGGCIQGWHHNGVDLINRAGMCGRSAFNSALFVTKPGVGVLSNPTQAGSKIDDYHWRDANGKWVDPKVQEFPRNLPQNTWVQGGRVLAWHATADTLHVEAIPAEWDPDGYWFAKNHGGSVFTQMEPQWCRFFTDIDFHIHPNVHRVRNGLLLPNQVPEDHGMVWDPGGLHLCFGFDDILLWEGGASRSILDAEMVPPIHNQPVTWADKGTFLEGTLNVPHGRRSATRQTVELDHIPTSVIFTGPQTIRLGPPKPTITPGTMLNAPKVVWAEFDDVQSRYLFQNRLTIGGGTGTWHHSDQTGAYALANPATGPVGVIYAAREGSSNPWSFNTDIAVGLLAPQVDVRAGPPQAHQRQLRWCSKRAKGKTPTNGVRDVPVVVSSYIDQWDPGTPKPRGLLESECWVAVGTLDEVRENLEWAGSQG